MRILFSTDRYPFPLKQGGSLRNYHFARCLAKRNDVQLVCFGTGDPPAP